MLRYNPCCFSLFILTKRATKNDSISIYDKNISMADLIANAPSHFVTLMLNSSELLTVIIWEEQEDSSKKVLKCCFPNCRHCKKTKKWSLIPSNIIVSFVTFKLWLLLTGTTRDFAVPQDFVLNYYWSPGLLFLANARLPDDVRGPLGIHSLALTHYFAQMFSLLCLIDTFHKQVKQILGGYWHQPGRW